MNVFVAVPVPDAVRDHLGSVVAPLRELAPELRWTQPRGWHVTLAFLGVGLDDRLDEVGAAVEGAVGRAVPRPRLEVTGAGRFGDRVLWAAVGDDPAGSLAALGSVLRTGIARAGLPVTERELVGHLTLARGGRASPVTSALGSALAASIAGRGGGPAWDVEVVQVWTSPGLPGGRGYTSVASFPLAG